MFISLLSLLDLCCNFESESTVYKVCQSAYLNPYLSSLREQTLIWDPTARDETTRTHADFLSLKPLQWKNKYGLCNLTQRWSNRLTYIKCTLADAVRAAKWFNACNENSTGSDRSRHPPRNGVCDLPFPSRWEDPSIVWRCSPCALRGAWSWISLWYSGTAVGWLGRGLRRAAWKPSSSRGCTRSLHIEKWNKQKRITSWNEIHIEVLFSKDFTQKPMFMLGPLPIGTSASLVSAPIPH